MKKEKGYEYHKQNEYPGERVAEQKRVADRAEEAENIADARVAEKGRMKDKLMTAEIERSTARAERVNRSRNAADTMGIVIVSGIILILLTGVVWGYSAVQKRDGEIDSLNLQIADSSGIVIISESGQLSNEAKQIQLHKDFLVLTADVKEEVKNLEDYNFVYSSPYQLCANLVERSNNVNHALRRFAEKEIVYYRQIAVLDNKPQCKAKIDNLNSLMLSSQIADEILYIQENKQCDRLMSYPIEEASTKLKMDYENALNDATAKAKAFTSAEKSVIACFV